MKERESLALNFLLLCFFHLHWWCPHMFIHLEKGLHCAEVYLFVDEATHLLKNKPSIGYKSLMPDGSTYLQRRFKKNM